MELDLPQIAAFVTAAEELHFGRAALRLFLTQQALSKRISRLEQTLGEPLFARRHNIVELTAAGHTFLPYSRKLLASGPPDASTGAYARGTPCGVWGADVATPSLVRMRETCTPAVLALLGGITRFASAAPVAVTAAREVPPCGIHLRAGDCFAVSSGFRRRGRLHQRRESGFAAVRRYLCVSGLLGG